MKVKILGKLIEESFKNIVEKAVRIYASELMSTKMCNTLSVKVEIRRGGKHFKDSDFLGRVYKDVIGCKRQKDFLIIMDYTLEENKFFEVSAHEMIHVKQFCKGEYQLRQWKSDGKIHARWNGEEVGILHNISYMERPWEIEAFGLQADLHKRFIKARI
jgi:hypothetical protein